MLAVGQAESLSFYEAAAQIFPVLFVAWTIEYSFLRGPPDEDAGWWEQLQGVLSVLVIFGVFIAGEWVTLDVLANDHASDSQREFVQGALVFTSGFLLARVMVRMARGMGKAAGIVVENGIYLALVIGALYYVFFT